MEILTAALHLLLAVAVTLLLIINAIPVVGLLRLDLGALERVVLAAGIGLGLMAWLTSIACLAGWFTPMYAWSVVGILGLGCVFWRKKGQSALRDAWCLLCGDWREAGRLSRLITVTCILLSLVGLVISLSPPDASDAGQYHLGLAKLFSLLGGYEHHPTWMRSGFSLNATMLFGFEMLLHPRDTVAMAWVIWVVEGFALVVFGERWFGRGAGYWYIPLWLAVGVTYAPVGGYAEGLLTLHWVLGLHMFAIWLRTGSAGVLLLSGFFVGTAAGTKPSGLAALAGWVLLAPLATKIWPGVESGKRCAGRSHLMALAVAVVTAAPWYVRNWHFEGNPVFPAFSSLFGSVELPEIGDKPWDIWKAFDRNLVDYLAALFKAAFDPPTGEVTTAWAEYTYGPWCLAFLPLFFLVRRPDRVSGFLIAWSLVQAWGWSLPSGGQGRHLYPFVQTIGPVAGAVLAHTYVHRRSLFFSLALLSSIAAVPVYGLMGSRGLLYLPSLTSSEGRDSFLEDRMPDAYPVIRHVNDNLDRNSRILILDLGISGALLDVPWRYGLPYGMQAAFQPRDWRNPEVFRRRLKREGITHVWLQRELLKSDWGPSFEVFLQRCATRRYSKGTIELHEIEWTDEPRDGGS